MSEGLFIPVMDGQALCLHLVRGQNYGGVAAGLDIR